MRKIFKGINGEDAREFHVDNKKCMKILFRKYGNAVVDSCIDCSQDVRHKLNFMWPGALNLEQWS